MKVQACVAVGMSLVAGCVGLKTDPTLAYYQKFDDAALKAAVGTWADGKMGDGEIVAGKFGNALHVLPRKTGAAVEVPAGVVGKKGCIEFWAKLDNGSGLMTSIFNPALFALTADGAGRLSIGFTTNEGHGDSGLQYHYWGSDAAIFARREDPDALMECCRFAGRFSRDYVLPELPLGQCVEFCGFRG